MLNFPIRQMLSNKSVGNFEYSMSLKIAHNDPGFKQVGFAFSPSLTTVAE
jgi:hypothetical protein